MANSLNTFKGSKNFEPNVKAFILSSSPMYSQQSAIPNEEFLVKFNYWLVRGGTITLKAWGIIINLIIHVGFNPIAAEASLCPLVTDKIPDLTVSEINAPV